MNVLPINEYEKHCIGYKLTDYCNFSEESLAHKVWQSFLNGTDYTLCISNEIVEEYLEVMTRNINKYVAETIIYTILTRENVKKFTPHYRFHRNYSRPG